jgi:bacterial/archaeal transporter family protein
MYLVMNWIHWSLLSAFFAGLTAIFAKLGITGVDSNLATAIRTTVICVFAWAITCAIAKPAAMLDFPGRTWIFLTLSGLATGLSWLCYFRALQMGDASRVAPLDKLSVVFVIVLAAVFLKEKMTLQHLGGGLLIVSGAVVLAWKSSKL